MSVRSKLARGGPRRWCFIVAGIASSHLFSTVAAAAPSWMTTFRDDFSGSGSARLDQLAVHSRAPRIPAGPANFGTGEIETLTNNPANVHVRPRASGHHAAARRRRCTGPRRASRPTRAVFKPPPAASCMLKAVCRCRMSPARRRWATGRRSGCWAARIVLTGGRGRASANSTSWRMSRA